MNRCRDDHELQGRDAEEGCRNGVAQLVDVSPNAVQKQVAEYRPRVHGGHQRLRTELEFRTQLLDQLPGRGEHVGRIDANFSLVLVADQQVVTGQLDPGCSPRR